jgi:L-threonylcarbamoyladenylate synthase
MRHRHYAPKGRLTLVSGDPQNAANEINRLYDNASNARILAMHANLPLYGNRLVNDLGSDAASAAHRLFYLLRAFDEQGVDQIFCETLPASGLGLAVMNRLARAAEFNIINV